MRLTKSSICNEETNLVSVEQMFYLLKDFLSEYVKADQHTLDNILEDWQYAVDEEESPEEVLPLTIPFKIENQIEFGFGNLDIYVDKNFKLNSTYETYIRFSPESNSFYLELNLPKIVDLLNTFSEGYGSYSLVEPIAFLNTNVTTLNQVEEFARKCKDILDSYTSKLNTVFEQLYKMDMECYSIWKIVREEEKLGR